MGMFWIRQDACLNRAASPRAVLGYQRAKKRNDESNVIVADFSRAAARRAA